MKKIILSLAILMSSYTFGQGKFVASESSNVFSNNLNVFALQKIDQVYSNQYISGLKGSVYYKEDFAEGALYRKKDAERFFQVEANYNLFTDQFELLFEDELYLINAEGISKIVLDGHVFIPTNKFLQGKAYFEELAANAGVQFVKTHEVRLLEVPSKTMGLIETKIKRFEKKYLIVNGALMEMPKNRKEFFAVLELSETQKNQFSKAHIKNDAEVIKIIQAL